MTDTTTEKTSKKKRGKKPGSSKTGGRKKGTRNRNSMTVLSSLDKANIPLIEFLVADIHALEPTGRIEYWFRLLSFCYPKLKEIDASPHLPPPSGAPAATETPPLPQSREERLRIIRGQVPGKPEASG